MAAIPGKMPLQRLCVVMDPRIAQANSEIHMSSKSIVFHYPTDATIDNIKIIVGNVITLCGLISGIRKSSTPVIIKTKKYKISGRNFDNYFLLMTSPTHLSSTSHINDFVLLLNSIKLYLGPLHSLSTRFGDNTTLFLSSVLSFIFQHTFHHNSNVFLNNLAVIPVRKSTPLKCQIMCCNLINDLSVAGGLVLYKKKVVYSNLPNGVVLSLLGLNESNIPVDRTSERDSVSITKVYVSKKHYPLKLQCESDTNKSFSNEEIDEMLDDFDKTEGTTLVNSDSDDEYEIVQSDLPEASDVGSSSKRRHSQYSRFTEFFDGRIQINKFRNRRTFSVDEQLFEDSIASHTSTFSELPGNSLAYKLFKSEEDTFCSRPFQVSSLETSREADTPVEGNLKDPMISHAQSLVSTASENSNRSNGEEAEDEKSENSEYHDALPPVKTQRTREGELFLSCDDDELVEMEAVVISRCNSRIIIIGEDILERNPNIKTVCVHLLGELSAHFTNNIPLESRQKCTADVQSFVYDKKTFVLQQNHANKVSPVVTKQLLLCKDIVDEESNVDLLCVKGVSCCTTLAQKEATDIYVSSRSLRSEKLADKLTDIAIRNFNSLLL